MVIIEGPKLDSTIPETDIFNFTFENVQEYMDKVALVDASTGDELTYRQYVDQIARVANGLTGLGVTKGTVVAIICSNILQTPVALFAALKIGAVVVPAMVSTATSDLSFQMKETEVEWVITEECNINKVEEVMKTESNVKGLIVINGRKHITTCQKWCSFESLLKCSPDLPLKSDQIQPDKDLGLIVYSSGTTGKPKGIMHTHKTMVAQAFCVQISEGSQNDETNLCILPLVQIFGIMFNVIHTARKGNMMVIISNFNIHNYLKAVQKFKPERLSMSPTIANIFVRSPVPKQYNMSCVKNMSTGGAPLMPSTENSLKELYDVIVGQGYGSTEVCALACSVPSFPRFRSAGLPINGSQFKIMDISDEVELNLMQPGELWFKTPSLMKGYYKKPELTQKVITEDGWYKTGDYGYFDDDGYLFIISRINDLIKYDSYIIAPMEIEDVLRDHPSVSDAAVVGIPDEQHGQLPKAFIVLSTESTITQQEILQYANENLADSRRLRGGLQIIEKIPRSPAGKTFYQLLLDM